MELRGVKTCTLCSGKGTHLEKTQSPLPTVALDDSGSECATATELLTRDADSLEVIRQTTIRAPATQESTSGFSRPTDIPVCPPAGTADQLRTRGDLMMRKGMTASLFMEATNSDVLEDDLKGLLGWEKDKEVTDPETVRTIQAFIRTQMGDKKYYANVWVKNIFSVTVEKKVYKTSGMKMLDRIVKHNNGEVAGPKTKCHLKKLWIRVQGEGSCFCGNRGDYHQSNSVYLEMGPDKCWQRCFCTDDKAGTSHKTCKDYSTGDGGGRKLSDKLLKLFTTAPAAGLSGSAPAMPAVHLAKSGVYWGETEKTSRRRRKKGN